MKSQLEVMLKAMQIVMADNAVERVSISHHMLLVKIQYARFVEVFGGRTDCQRLSSEIRCECDGITYCADERNGTLEEIKV